MENILICDFTGLPLREEEISALVSASVLYLRQKQAGLVRFEHEYVEGEIEAHGTVSNGPLHGERFTAKYEWAGQERSIGFVLPPIARKIRIPRDAVVFYARESGRRSKRTLH